MRYANRHGAYRRKGLLQYPGWCVSESIRGCTQPNHLMITPANEHGAFDSETSTRARILIVDDDAQVSQLYTLVLIRAGYDVATAPDGAGALEQFADCPFDLVLTDRFMPNLDGATMILAIRSAGSKIPIVMASGSLVRQPLPAVIARELSAALPKPVHVTEILSAVEQALKSPPRESLFRFFYPKPRRGTSTSLASRKSISSQAPKLRGQQQHYGDHAQDCAERQIPQARDGTPKDRPPT